MEMSLTDQELLSERFRIFFISELLMIFTLPPPSVMEVVRIPMRVTTPRKPLTSTMSPTLYWFSSSMNAPMTTSAIRLSALKPTTRARTPTLAMMVPTLTPSRDRLWQTMMMPATYLTRLASRDSMEPPRWERGLMQPSTKMMMLAASRITSTIMTSFSREVIFTVKTAPSSLKSNRSVKQPTAMTAASRSR